MAWYYWKGVNTLVIELRIQPRAKQDEIAGIFSDRLRIRIKAPPVDGRANDTLVKFLAGQFGVAASKVKILRGQGSREKSLAIHSPVIQPDWFLALVKETD